MTKAPGESPGPSAWKPQGYSRAGIALAIAAAGLVVTVALLLAWGGFSGRLTGLVPGASTIIVAVVTSVPLVIAVWAAGRFAGAGGVGRATGIRPWIWTDALLGVAAGVVMRSIIEVVSPTIGSLGGPLGFDGVGAAVAVIVTAVVVSPVVEELFFRGLVVRALAQSLAGAGTALAAVVTILLSTALFVALHTVTLQGAVPVSLVISAAIIGAGCGILTLATGRLGAALVAHVVSNLVGIVLLVA